MTINKGISNADPSTQIGADEKQDTNIKTQDTDKKQISRYKYLIIGYWCLSGYCLLYLDEYQRGSELKNQS